MVEYLACCFVVLLCTCISCKHSVWSADISELKLKADGAPPGCQQWFRAAADMGPPPQKPRGRKPKATPKAKAKALPKAKGRAKAKAKALAKKKTKATPKPKAKAKGKARAAPKASAKGKAKAKAAPKRALTEEQRMMRSKKSSAYHVACNAARKEGYDEEEAKRRGREVP